MDHLGSESKLFAGARVPVSKSGSDSVVRRKLIMGPWLPPGDTLRTETQQHVRQAQEEQEEICYIVIAYIQLQWKGIPRTSQL